MMIEIDEEDYLRLKKLAEPLVDTSATVIARLIDFYERHSKSEDQIVIDDTDLPVLSFDIPPMRHTKLLAVEFDGSEPDRLTWDALLRLAIERAASKAKDFTELKRVCGSNMVEGVKTDQGYKPIHQLGISYQGVSAEDAIRIVARISGYLGAICRIEFEWRRKSGAFRPGERAFGNLSGEFVSFSQTGIANLKKERHDHHHQ